MRVSRHCTKVSMAAAGARNPNDLTGMKVDVPTGNPVVGVRHPSSPCPRRGAWCGRTTVDLAAGLSA